VAIVVLDGVWKVYSVGKVTVTALRDISLQVEEGEFVSIMGPSGSGKTTLLNIVGCLDLPSRGAYRFCGQPVQQMRDRALAALRNERIGFVFQTFNLLPYLTALGNVELPLMYRGILPRRRRRMAARVLEEVGLGDRLHHRPAELSGGEQQRVAIARALVGQPSLILADEPTGNLDSTTGRGIMELFKQLNQTHGVTIIQVTHNQEVASYGSRVISMRDGMICSDEAVREGR